MIALEEAIVEALAPGGTLHASLSGEDVTGVWEGTAPEGSSYPVVLFTKQVGQPVYTHGARVARSFLYLVKAVDSFEPGAGVDKTRVCAIDEAVDALLSDQILDVGGDDSLSCRREGDVDYPELDHGVLYLHVGGLYRVWTAVP